MQAQQRAFGKWQQQILAAIIIITSPLSSSMSTFVTSPPPQVDPVAQLLQANRSNGEAASDGAAQSAEVEKLKEKLKVR